MENKSFNISINDKEVPVYFDKPTQQQLLQLNLHEKRMFAEAVRGGIMTTAEATKLYEKNGSWTKDDEKCAAHIMFELGTIENLLKDKDADAEVKSTAALKGSSLRIDLIRLNKTKMDLFENTAESFAEEQKLHKFIELCLKTKEDDERFFNSTEEYSEFAAKHKDALSFIFRKAYLYDYNLPEDITQDWPEVQYINQLGKVEKDKMAKAEKSKQLKKSKKRPTKKRKNKDEVSLK